MRADLPTFIATLRKNREARSESLYASNKVYALLDAAEALAARMGGTLVVDKDRLDIVGPLFTSPVVPVAAKGEAEGWRPAETCPKERGTLIEVQVFEHIQRWDASKFHNAFDGDNRKFLWRPFAPTREGEGQ